MGYVWDMNINHLAQLLREHRQQMREREDAQYRPLHEILGKSPPLTPEQKEAQRRARLLHGGPGTATDVDR